MAKKWGKKKKKSKPVAPKPVASKTVASKTYEEFVAGAVDYKQNKTDDKKKELIEVLSHIFFLYSIYSKIPKKKIKIKGGEKNVPDYKGGRDDYVRQKGFRDNIKDFGNEDEINKFRDDNILAKINKSNKKKKEQIINWKYTDNVPVDFYKNIKTFSTKMLETFLQNINEKKNEEDNKEDNEEDITDQDNIDLTMLLLKQIITYDGKDLSGAEKTRFDDIYIKFSEEEKQEYTKLYNIAKSIYPDDSKERSGEYKNIKNDLSGWKIGNPMPDSIKTLYTRIIIAYSKKKIEENKKKAVDEAVKEATNKYEEAAKKKPEEKKQEPPNKPPNKQPNKPQEKKINDKIVREAIAESNNTPNVKKEKETKRVEKEEKKYKKKVETKEKDIDTKIKKLDENIKNIYTAESDIKFEGDPKISSDIEVYKTSNITEKSKDKQIFDNQINEINNNISTKEKKIDDIIKTDKLFNVSKTFLTEFKEFQKVVVEEEEKFKAFEVKESGVDKLSISDAITELEDIREKIMNKQLQMKKKMNETEIEFREKGMYERTSDRARSISETSGEYYDRGQSAYRSGINYMDEQADRFGRLFGGGDIQHGGGYFVDNGNVEVIDDLFKQIKKIKKDAEGSSETSEALITKITNIYKNIIRKDVVSPACAELLNKYMKERGKVEKKRLKTESDTQEEKDRKEKREEQELRGDDDNGEGAYDDDVKISNIEKELNKPPPTRISIEKEMEGGGDIFDWEDGDDDGDDLENNNVGGSVGGSGEKEYFSNVRLKVDRLIFYTYYYDDLLKTFVELNKKMKKDFRKEYLELYVNYHNYFKDLFELLKNGGRDKLIEKIESKYETAGDFNDKFSNYGDGDNGRNIHLTSIKDIIKRIRKINLKKLKDDVKYTKL